jgi:hypothetical protein
MQYKELGWQPEEGNPFLTNRIRDITYVPVHISAKKALASSTSRTRMPWLAIRGILNHSSFLLKEVRTVRVTVSQRLLIFHSLFSYH